jgi:exodeoxyribonuclease VII large subunit
MGNETKILTVSEVANRISEVIADYLPPVYVEGEVSNYYRSRAGHVYFSLKDEKALVNAVIWSYQADNIKFKINDGMRVVVYGEVITYKLRSQYQIRVQSVRASGLGNLYQAFEELKQKLDAEGLFDSDHKKEIPPFPSTIGVITSPTSAAVRDIIQVSGRRNPAVRLIVYPAVVQGEKAAETIISGIEYFNRQRDDIDMIIISRGGGSIEDLWAFNEESVVRAIYDSRLPVVTGIGHEIDFTLSDFAADYRAPTPSAAAEESVPELRMILDVFTQLELAIGKAMTTKISNYQQIVTHLDRQINLLNPGNIINNQIQHIDDIERRLIYLFNNKLTQMKNEVDYLSSSLNSLNPERILERGYAIVFNKEEKLIKTLENIHESDPVRIKLHDGDFQAKVTSKEKKLH